MQEHTTPPQTPDEEGLDLVESLEVVLRNKKFVLGVTFAAAVLAAIVSLCLPKIYESTARILPPQQDQGFLSLMMGQLGGATGGLANLAGGVLGAVSPADQYASILESEQIEDPIIDRYKLMDEYHKEYRVDMYKKMDKIVDIKAGRKDGIITITVQDEDPKKAAAIANAYVDELSNLVVAMSSSDAGRNLVFLTDRLEKAKADLARAEDALKAFQVQNKSIDVPDQAKATIEGVALLKGQIAVQEAQLSALRSQFTDSQPEVKAIQATIANLNRQVAALEGAGGGSIPSVGSVPKLGEAQIRLLRELKVQEMVFELLTKQVEMAKLNQAKTVSTIQVIQKAKPADKKSSPKRTLIVLAAAFLAGCGSVGWVLFREFRTKIPETELRKWRRVRAALAWKQVRG